MRTDPVIQRALARFKEVQEIMAKAASVRQEFYDLEAFLRQTHHLFPDAFESWPLPGMDGGATPPTSTYPTSMRVADSMSVADSNPPVGSKPTGALSTSEFAAWILRVHGPLHLREILKHMRAEGWRGNKDRKKAGKTLFNVMASHKDRFKNLGANIWELAEKNGDNV